MNEIKGFVNDTDTLFTTDKNLSNPIGFYVRNIVYDKIVWNDNFNHSLDLYKDGEVHSTYNYDYIKEIFYK